MPVGDAAVEYLQVRGSAGVAVVLVAADYLWVGLLVVLGQYDAGFPGLVGDWDAQLDFTWIVGLLLRGWRKGLDAEAGVILPSRMSAADDLAWWCARADEAAGRRL